MSIKNHGLSKHRLYEIWIGLRKRCNNPNSKRYCDYGAKGILVCEEWNSNFMSFYNWSLNNGYKDNLSIDRINNNLGYFPSNCRWATQEIQSRNTRRIRENNSSGYRGVSFKKAINKFQCRINVDKKQIYLGVYITAIDAAKTYDKYVLDNNLEHTINGV